jgi:hypothetical protein
VKPERKQRSDAGDVCATREECIAFSAILMSTQRKTGKRLISITQAVGMARANGEVKFERTDPATGEVHLLSDSAINRALKQYCLHPDQLNRPAPAKELKSLHPNHVWQVDASVCVLYYLSNSTGKNAGLQVMEEAKFNKNKPKNLSRIESDRVISYEVTDHYSGSIYVEYVMGSEGGKPLSEIFINVMQKREGHVMHGVPFVLMMDQGSAMSGGLFKNLTRRLKIKPEPHAAGNARVTGQVEKARDIIERSFESSLSFKGVADLAELNTKAQRWSAWYNANQIHSRHSKTRADMWMTIAQEQLRIAPSVEICQELLTNTAELRTVTDFLTVSWKGADYDVSSVPGVMIRQKLPITTSPYEANAVLVELKDADGHELLHSAPKVERDEAGFREVGANVISEDFSRMADTILETNRKEVERFTYEAATDEEAADKRKAKALPFGGRIDPYKTISDAPVRTFLPKRGEELVVNVTTASTAVEEKLLEGFELARALAELGIEMSREKNALVASLYPNGVAESELPALQARLAVRSGLRVVNGGMTGGAA